jgi:hypothetical protein
MDSEATASRVTLGVLPPPAAMGWEVGRGHRLRLGTVSEIPNEEAAWRRVDELGLARLLRLES